MAHKMSKDETQRKIKEYLKFEVQNLLERLNNYPRGLLPGDIMNYILNEITGYFRRPKLVRDPEIFKGEVRSVLVQTQFLVCQKWRRSTTIDLDTSDDETIALDLFEYLMKWEPSTESAMLLTALVVRIGLHRFCEEIPRV